MSTAASIGRVWLQTFTSTTFVTFFSLLSSILTARLLGPDGRGLMAAAFLIASLTSGVAQVGLANSLVYHYGKDKSTQNKQLLGASAALITLLTVPLSLAGLRYLYPETYEHSSLLIILLGATSALFSFSSTASQISADLKIYNTTRTIPPLLLSVFLIGTLTTGHALNYTTIILFQILVMTALSIYMIVHVHQRLTTQKSTFKTLLKSTKSISIYAIKYHGTILLSLLLLNIDKIFLLEKVSAAQFGFYALAFSTTRILGSIQDAAAVTIFSRFAGKDAQGLESSVINSFRFSFIPMMLIAAIASGASPTLIPLVFGQSFASMIIPFALLSFEAVIGAASWTLAQRFNASGRPGMVLLRQCIVILPLLATLPYLPAENTTTWLAALMLIAALLRLIITLAMFPLVLNEPLPRIFPRWLEIKDLAGKLNRGRVIGN